MIIKVYEGTEVEEKTVRLRLVPWGNGVVVDVVDLDGDMVSCGSLCTISKKGISVCQGVDPNLGFSLDAFGALKVLKGE